MSLISLCGFWDGPMTSWTAYPLIPWLLWLVMSEKVGRSIERHRISGLKTEMCLPASLVTEGRVCVCVCVSLWVRKGIEGKAKGGEMGISGIVLYFLPEI